MDGKNGQDANGRQSERLGCALTADILTAEDWEDMLATHNRMEAAMEALRDRILKRHNKGVTGIPNT